MEEKQDDLDNLIIQSKKPSGPKKILLAAAILLLVLILIILVTKSFVGSDNRASSSVILPPEPVAKEAAPPKEPLFEQVPIEEDKSGTGKIDQVIERAKQSASKESEPAVQKPEESRTVQQEPKQPVESLVKAEPEPKPAPAPKTAKTKAATGGYYIQVGAFFRYPPDKKFLDSIRRENLNYIIVEGKKSGKPYKKVLVGPYQSRSAAKKDLERVKKRINQNAYITEKK
ncbi:membrane protein [Hydrogenimonas sp.]|nr:membrane protein [Hydrogenimonas sp.]